MNRFFIVSVSKKIIFEKIRVFTSYLSGKRAENPLEYERVATADLDIPLLDYIAEDVALYLASNLGKMLKEISINGDILRFELEAYGADTSIIYGLIESFIISETILRWLRIVGYEFSDSSLSLQKSAEEVALSKLSQLRKVLDPDGLASRKRILKASPRGFSPI